MLGRRRNEIAQKATEAAQTVQAVKEFRELYRPAAFIQNRKHKKLKPYVESNDASVVGM